MRAARPTAATERPALLPTPQPLPTPTGTAVGSTLPPPPTSAGAATPPPVDEPWDALDAGLALVGLVGLTVGLAIARGAWGKVAVRLVWPTKSRTL